MRGPGGTRPVSFWLPCMQQSLSLKMVICDRFTFGKIVEQISCCSHNSIMLTPLHGKMLPCVGEDGIEWSQEGNPCSPGKPPGVRHTRDSYPTCGSIALRSSLSRCLHFVLPSPVDLTNTSSSSKTRGARNVGCQPR